MVPHASNHTPTASLPALDNGQAGYVSPGFVGRAQAHPVSLLWDIGLPLVAAVALPLLLKYALESGIFSRFFRFSSPRGSSPQAIEEEDFDE